MRLAQISSIPPERSSAPTRAHATLPLMLNISITISEVRYTTRHQILTCLADRSSGIWMLNGRPGSTPAVAATSPACRLLAACLCVPRQGPSVVAGCFLEDPS